MLQKVPDKMKYTSEKFNMFASGFCLMGAMDSFSQGNTFGAVIQIFFSIVNFLYGGKEYFFPK